MSLLVGTVTEVVHDDFEFYLVVRRAEDGLVIVGDQSHVIEIIEFVEFCGSRKVVGAVICEPARDVPVQVVRDCVEQVLDNLSVPCIYSLGA